MRDSQSGHLNRENCDYRNQIPEKTSGNNTFMTEIVAFSNALRDQLKGPPVEVDGCSEG